MKRADRCVCVRSDPFLCIYSAIVVSFRIEFNVRSNCQTVAGKPRQKNSDRGNWGSILRCMHFPAATDCFQYTFIIIIIILIYILK